VIAPKFNIGSKVWVATTSTEPVAIMCPDCLDKRRWECALPNGDRLLIPCSSCEGGGPRIYTHRPRTWEGTVGSVRINTEDKQPVSYMLTETGVGSGSVYYEESVFATESEARVTADALCVARQKAVAENLLTNIMYKRRNRKGGLVGHLRNEIREVERRLESLRSHLNTLQNPVGA